MRPLYGHPRELVATAAHPPLFSSVLAVFDTLGLKSLTEQRVAPGNRRFPGRPDHGSARARGLRSGRGDRGSPHIGAGPAVARTNRSVDEREPLPHHHSARHAAGAPVSRKADILAVRGVRSCHRSGGTDPERSDRLRGAARCTAAPHDSWLVEKSFRAGWALLVGVTLLLGPWLVRNELKMGGAVLSTQEGGTLLGSYCSSAFDRANPAYGSFSAGCAIGFAAILRADVKPPDRAQGWTELSLDRATTESAKQYALSHLGDLPRVVLAREASAWGLGNQNFQLQLAEAEGRNRTSELVGKAIYWVLVPFVIIGAITLARRSPRRFVVVVVPIAVAVLTVALTYGSTRLRVVAEPSLAVLAALGLVCVIHWLSSHVLHATKGLSQEGLHWWSVRAGRRSSAP